ncbi:MAG: hypothetical protein LBN19_01375 [Endomicrobium sp.]|jgi:heat shock protein HtpX|nr:hypothetical protein [Endomicrobium sp.]
MAYDFVSDKSCSDSLSDNTVGNDNSQIYNRVSMLAVASQTAVHVLPAVSIMSILWVLISYYAGQNFILSAVGAIELTKKMLLK